MTAISLLIPDDDDESKENLLRRFSDCFRVTVEALVVAAQILAKWQSRGWDITELQAVAGKWLYRLRMIQSGQLLPELAVKLDGQPALLDRFSRLHVDDQRLIIEDRAIPVGTFVNLDGKETWTTLKMLPSELMHPKAAFQRKQVFDTDHIRSVEQQRKWLATQAATSRTPRPDKVGKFNIDRARGGATHRGEFITLAELVDVVKALRK